MESQVLAGLFEDVGEAPDTPSLRLLEVVEALARCGPLTLAALVAELGLPRGAVFRALCSLRRKHWVRMRHGDRAFVLRAPMVGLLRQAPHSAAEVEAALPLFERLAAVGPVHVDLGLFTGAGEVRVVETTRKAGYGGACLSLTDDDLALVAQLQLPPGELVRHLTVYLDRATAEERRIIASGDHARHLKALRLRRVLFHEDGTAVALAPPGLTGVGLRAELWRPSRQHVAGLRDAVAALMGQGTAGVGRA